LLRGVVRRYAAGAPSRLGSRGHELWRGTLSAEAHSLLVVGMVGRRRILQELELFLAPTSEAQ
jgi:hypothetical protein